MSHHGLRRRSCRSKNLDSDTLVAATSLLDILEEPANTGTTPLSHGSPTQPSHRVLPSPVHLHAHSPTFHATILPRSMVGDREGIVSRCGECVRGTGSLLAAPRHIQYRSLAGHQVLDKRVQAASQSPSDRRREDICVYEDSMAKQQLAKAVSG